MNRVVQWIRTIKDFFLLIEVWFVRIVQMYS